MRTSSRNFAVVLFDEVDLLDVASLMHVTSVAGRHYNWRPFRLLTVARQAELLETRGQLRIEAKHSFADCPVPELLFVPGGYGARRAAEDAQCVEWCRQAAAGAVLTVAVGAGCAVLGAAGLLDGASIAGSTEVRAWLSSSLPKTTFEENEPIVSSRGGQLITAASSGHATELALSVVEHQLGRRLALTVRTQLGIANVSRLDLLEPPKITLPSR